MKDSAAIPAVEIPTWITFGLVALTLAAAFSCVEQKRSYDKAI